MLVLYMFLSMYKIWKVIKPKILAMGALLRHRKILPLKEPQ